MTALLELGGMSWAMTGVCAGCGVMELVLRSTLRRSYRRSWQQFRQQNGPDGTVNFDAGGIREENEKGKPTHFDWADWDVCVMTPKVIVLTFKTRCCCSSPIPGRRPSPWRMPPGPSEKRTAWCIGSGYESESC